MKVFPNAFETPVWYIAMHINGTPNKLTQKRYSNILANRLNRDQFNSLIGVEDYTILPGALYLIIREAAMSLNMWLPVFMEITALQLHKRWLTDRKAVAGGNAEYGEPVPAHWENLTQERITDFETFDRRAYQMLYLPVWKGFAEDPEDYGFNSINNKAGIKLL